MEEIPKELDWVRERAKCDIKRAFADLTQAVKGDIDEYNAESKLKPNYQIAFHEDPSGWGFTVSRNSNLAKTVLFMRTDTYIEISVSYPSNGPKLQAVPVLSESGRCKFEVEGKDDLEQWQLRRLALEDLFFGALL